MTDFVSIGFDIGKYAVKAADGARLVRFPSAAVSPDESLFTMDGRGRIVVESEHGAWLVGEHAVKMGQPVRYTTAEWIGSDQWMSLMYGAYSELDRSDAQACVVLGLPLSDYTSAARRIKIALRGDHVFTRQGQPSTHIDMRVVRVVPQAWGIVLDELLDANGEIVHPEMLDQSIAVIDIGGHNINYLSVAGLSDVPSESLCTDGGAWTVCDHVRSMVVRDHPGLRGLRDHQIARAIAEREIMVGGATSDLTGIVEPLLRSTGEGIVATAERLWGDGAERQQKVYLIGGGAYLWGDYLRKAMPQMRVPDSPEFANAIGFQKYATYLVGQA